MALLLAFSTVPTLVGAFLVEPLSSFTEIHANSRPRTCIRPSETHLASFSPFVSEVEGDGLLANEPEPEKADSTIEPIMDQNGREFEVGNIARVSMENLRAFQVAKSGKGAFDATNKQFVPNPESPYLLLPVGLRGVITKVYHSEELSANFQIQVKFDPKTYLEEGFAAPVGFTMHFAPDEVDCVV